MSNKEETHSYARLRPNGNTFLTGRLGEPATCCGWVASFLCDYPVGDDATCDKRICEDHAHEIAPDMHYCKEHYKKWVEFEKSGGVKKHLENVTPVKAHPFYKKRKLLK